MNVNRQEILKQIGFMTVGAISGGRVIAVTRGVDLPVSRGYRVRVELMPDDIYTVSRIYKRGAKEWNKGSREQVYFDELSDAAYYASCYQNDSATNGVWVYGKGGEVEA